MQKYNAGERQEVARRFEPKKKWSTPALTKLKIEDAESGNNVSENGAFGS